MTQIKLGFTLKADLTKFAPLFILQGKEIVFVFFTEGGKCKRNGEFLTFTISSSEPLATVLFNELRRMLSYLVVRRVRMYAHA